MSRPVVLSKSAIENIFQLRADGKTFKAIAERYPCSDHYIRQVIARNVYGNVEIDAGLVHGAQNVITKRKKYTKKSARKTNGNKFAALAKMMEAYSAFLIAYKEACSTGLSKELLEAAKKECQKA